MEKGCHLLEFFLTFFFRKSQTNGTEQTVSMSLVFEFLSASKGRSRRDVATFTLYVLVGKPSLSYFMLSGNPIRIS